ncbi:proprotein convertase subtilisin/kexin type 5 [Onychostoma macrolepis]|uniref:proprotein convertase subtilisin/kexin type 5 n=1 Tax=Onychostoma macrolepis TaxID=369639 RepID=UPI00272C2544|nr:proprotein convertase subtilisin/kexin type 5 [Onychostoma macrolepis]
MSPTALFPYAFLLGIGLQCVQTKIYTNRWAVKITEGPDAADLIAGKYGFVNMGQIGGLVDHYQFQHSGIIKRSTIKSGGNHSLITTETKVKWIQQQMVQKRVKRTDTTDQTHAASFNDPKWDSMWYIHCDHNCLTDMNIQAAWRRGYTGKGVVVSILDDGIEKQHPDLKQNYDARASYDVNDNDPDPTPRYDATNENKHGTRCAGVVAASANNSLCIVGIAYNAKIGGVRMLDGDMTDMVEAQSLSLKQQYIDIYSSSWGPDDDGRTVDGPGPLARLALENGIRKGRKGRGSIFVWASGNGGQSQDHCSCDGYTNSIYTISVGSTTQSGRKPWYLEECSSTLATTYSSGDSHSLGVLTTDLRQRCTDEHSGTSASAPMAAGIIALTLEANPSLTWRDVQHIVVKTSRRGHLSASDWQSNAAGYDVSHLYGFGLMDAEAMVKEAETWKQVPPQHVCEENIVQTARIISAERVLRSVFKSSGCSSQRLQRVVYLEHVVVRVTITHPHRGDLSVTLTSPAGTRSQLLTNRPNDHSSEGFLKWEFMTTHCWGERPAGDWILDIRDSPSPRRNSRLQGKLVEWSLVLYGTSTHPYIRHEQPRSAQLLSEDDTTEEYNGSCDPECSEDGCEGPGPHQCVSCLHFFLKFKNNTRTCVSECPSGYWGDKKRCKKCYSSCESCLGSRSDQCTACKSGYHLNEEKNNCVTNCEDGYYLYQEENVCRKCNIENCMKCTSASICTECSEGTSLVGNRCQKSCEVGHYYSEPEDSCEPCHPACATCAAAGLESCNRCAEGYLMENWRCVSSCSQGFYAVQLNSDSTDTQSTCKRCDASCLACVGPGKENCSECVDGHTLLDGVCVLSHNCVDGEYQDESGECQPCDESCHKCKGPTSVDCLSCSNTHWLDEGRCVVSCSNGKYPSSGQCHLCDHTCAQCVDAGPANCTSCDTDKFGVDRYLYRGECVEVCPQAHFHTVLKACEPCPSHCKLCSSATHCIRCEDSFYLNDGVCNRLECGEGEVEDPEYDDCMSCEEGCNKCVLYNPKHCLSCIGGYYKFEEGCYKHCPAKTYTVEQNMSCASCEHDCVSCDEDECYWCESDLFLSDGKCVRECPDGFYGDEDSQECEECHSDCRKCSGPEDSDCDSCGDGFTLDNGACVPEQDVCPAQEYLTDDGECEACHSSCESCWGEMNTQCNTCLKGQYLNADQMCVARCPAGSFGSKESGHCETCPQGCAQCQDEQLCTRCQSARKNPLYLQAGQCVRKCTRGYPVGQVCKSCASGCTSCEKNATNCLSCEETLLLHKHECVEGCPPGHTVRNRECVQCPESCVICSEDRLCTECKEDFFLHAGQCIVVCPDGFFEDTDQGICERCHADCELCDGPEPNNCDSCSDTDHTLHNGACLAPCPAHTYKESRSGECMACDSSCLTCSGPHDTSCSSCSEGLAMDAHGRCATPITCPSHHYSNQDGECHLCHKYCHECSGPHQDQCLSCNQNHYLLNGSCVNQCPDEFFRGETQRCEPCHPNCLTCMGRHSHECLSCRAHLYRDVKECVDTCRSGRYASAVSRTCERCHESCGECLQAGAEGCVSCREGMLFIRKQGRCVSYCPEAYYHDTHHKTCEACHPSCRTCTGKSVEVCESCHPGYTHTQGVCESPCITGEYAEPEEQGYKCVSCDESCLECKGPGPHNCTICPAQFILTAEGHCLPCCTNEKQEDTAAVQQECCNCTETRGECVLSTNVAFRNHEEEEYTGNLPLFITASILLVLASIAVIILIKRSLAKRPIPEPAVPRGYEKLGNGGGRDSFYRGTSSSAYGGQASSSSGRFCESKLVDLGDQKGNRVDDDEDDEDEDIVYMGQDGTVYRKFRYGQLGDEQEDELEYDDESYNYR